MSEEIKNHLLNELGVSETQYKNTLAKFTSATNVTRNEKSGSLFSSLAYDSILAIVSAVVRIRYEKNSNVVTYGELKTHMKSEHFR